MTHPFHPLFGRSFELIDARSTWGEDRVFFSLDGRLLRLPATWTDAAPLSPFVVIAAGRARLRFDDLVALAELVGRQRAARTSTEWWCRVSGELRRVRKGKNAVCGGVFQRAPTWQRRAVVDRRLETLRAPRQPPGSA